MKKALLILGLTLLSVNQLFAQPGTLDPHFGINGKMTDDRGYQITSLVQEKNSDKIVAVGSALYGGIILRYNLDGTPDNTFGNGGMTMTDGGDMYYDVLILPDGKFLAVGSWNDINANVALMLTRFNTNGSVDATFGNNGTVHYFPAEAQYGYLFSVTITPDNKILAGGYGGPVSAMETMILSRFNMDGSLDTSFDNDGILTFNYASTGSMLNEICMQGDNILVVGVTTTSTNVLHFLGRFHPDGTPDTSFGLNGSVISGSAGDPNSYYSSIKLQKDGKILIGGSNYDPTSNKYVFSVSRFSPDGQADLAFANNGIATVMFDSGDAYVNSLELEESGKIVALGSVNVGPNPAPSPWPDEYAVSCLNSDGSPNTSFGTGGKNTVSFGVNNSGGVSCSLLQKDGGILVAGLYEDYPDEACALARFLGDDQAGLETIENDKLTIYPNPTLGKTILKSDVVLIGQVYTLTDASGRTIQTGTIPGTEQILDLSGFQPGMYFFHAGNQQLPIVKQ